MSPSNLGAPTDLKSPHSLQHVCVPLLQFASSPVILLFGKKNKAAQLIPWEKAITIKANSF